jgi:hypothetical protein
MNPFNGRHFQREIIRWAVRWYCKYGISFRELGPDYSTTTVFAGSGHRPDTCEHTGR